MHNTPQFKGLIQVYTGDGKGKTTASLGAALRAAGRSLKVTIVQFMKNGDSGEYETLKAIPNISIKHFGRDGFVSRENPAPEDIALAEEGLQFAREQLSEAPALLVLDEINNALYFNLLSEEVVLQFLNSRPEATEFILTGRNAPESILKVADLVTEMREVRHPWRKNIPARIGIEF